MQMGLGKLFSLTKEDEEMVNKEKDLAGELGGRRKWKWRKNKIKREEKGNQIKREKKKKPNKKRDAI